ncbi:hypothetical protein [Paenochrobactrum pullorum]|uniref:hypothetical protein n=1 Tax=Paenochrobactrum pullorum TaxID=1324351 RepID=UPI0035BBB770
MHCKRLGDLHQRIDELIERTGSYNRIAEIRREYARASAFWERARLRRKVEQDQGLSKDQRLAHCIADEFERRGLVIYPREPGRLDSPEAPMWTRHGQA